MRNSSQHSEKGLQVVPRTHTHTHTHTHREKGMGGGRKLRGQERKEGGLNAIQETNTEMPLIPKWRQQEGEMIGTAGALGFSKCREPACEVLIGQFKIGRFITASIPGITANFANDGRCLVRFFLTLE